MDKIGHFWLSHRNSAEEPLNWSFRVPDKLENVVVPLYGAHSSMLESFVTKFGLLEGENAYQIRDISQFRGNYGQKSINRTSRVSGKLEKAAERRPLIAIHTLESAVTEFGALEGESLYRMRKTSHFRCQYGRECRNWQFRVPDKLEKSRKGVARSLSK